MKTNNPAKNTLEEEEELVLSLAPFTPIPKVCFNNIQVGKSSTERLKIKNPTDRDIQVRFFVVKIIYFI